MENKEGRTGTGLDWVDWVQLSEGIRGKQLRSQKPTSLSAEARVEKKKWSREEE